MLTCDCTSRTHHPSPSHFEASTMPLVSAVAVCVVDATFVQVDVPSGCCQTSLLPLLSSWTISELWLIPTLSGLTNPTPASRTVTTVGSGGLPSCRASLPCATTENESTTVGSSSLRTILKTRPSVSKYGRSLTPGRISR